MQYALLMYNKPGAMESLSPVEREATSKEYWALRDTVSLAALRQSST